MCKGAKKHVLIDACCQLSGDLSWLLLTDILWYLPWYPCFCLCALIIRLERRYLRFFLSLNLSMAVLIPGMFRSFELSSIVFVNGKYVILKSVHYSVIFRLRLWLWWHCSQREFWRAEICCILHKVGLVLWWTPQFSRNLLAWNCMCIV